MAKHHEINEAILRKADRLENQMARQLVVSFRLRLSIEDVLRLMADVNSVDDLDLPEVQTNILKQAFVSGGEIVAATI